MKIVQNEEPEMLPNEEIQEVTYPRVEPKFKEIDFNNPNKIIETKKEPKSIFPTQLPVATPYGNIDFSKKKKTWGTKSWWIFKTPLLVYLLLSYGTVYLAGRALSVYLTNSSITYGALGLHTIMLLAFIFLCVATKGDKK